jgi:hypothetical protein
MPLPEKRRNESRGEFVTRCYSDPKMNKEYPKDRQRMAVCLNIADRTDFDNIGIRGGEKRRFNTYSYPKYITETAKKALNWIEENGNPNGCMTQTGKVRLQTLAQGKPVSLDILKRMKNYITRHRKDLETSKSFDDGCGYLSMAAWGAEPSTIDKVLSFLERKITELEE